MDCAFGAERIAATALWRPIKIGAPDLERTGKKKQIPALRYGMEMKEVMRKEMKEGCKGNEGSMQRK